MDRITDFDRITTAIDPTGAIETYIWDEILGCQWESIGQIAQQLESGFMQFMAVGQV
jgi:hypothetical protein